MENLIIFLSGYSGFVGKNVFKYLKKAYTIKNVDLRKSSYFQQNLLANSPLIAIFHFAGKAHDTKGSTEEVVFMEVNFGLTKSAYDYFLESSAQIFITLSSVKAAADKVNDVLTEDIDSRPTTYYGKSKLLAEQYIFSKPIPEGKRVYVLRPCMIHGPGNKGNLNLLFSVVKKGFPYPLAAFDNRRSFLSIDNLCFVIDKLISDASIPSGIYNVADDDALSTNEVIKIISKEIGKKSKLWNVPKSIIKFTAKMGDILHLPLTTERLQKLTESYVVSNEKIKNVMKVSFPVSAEDGLRKTIRSFIENNA